MDGAHSRAERRARRIAHDIVLTRERTNGLKPRPFFIERPVQLIMPDLVRKAEAMASSQYSPDSTRSA